MSVLIYTCRIKEKVSGLVETDEEMDALYAKYDALQEEIIVLKNLSKYEDFISPFEEGVYTYESAHIDVDMNYGCYGDFLQRLEDMQDVVDDYHAYSTTISVSGIDNCISYKVAEEVLEEFKKYQKETMEYFMNNDGEEYGSILCGCYKDYMKVLQKCVELKGIVRYH